MGFRILTTLDWLMVMDPDNVLYTTGASQESSHGLGGWETTKRACLFLGLMFNRLNCKTTNSQSLERGFTPANSPL